MGASGGGSRREWLSRRHFITGTAAVAAGSVGVAAGRQAGTVELAAYTSGWEGQAPSAIEGKVNPTLRFQPGRTYEIIWENVDGESHTFLIVDRDGNELEQSEILENTGETSVLTVDATREMVGYRCDFHPETMSGSLRTVTAEQAQDVTAEEQPGFGALAGLAGVTGAVAHQLRQK